MTRPFLKHPEDWEVETLEPDLERQVILDAASGSTPDTGNPANWGGPTLWLTPKEVTNSATTYRLVSSTERTLSGTGAREAGRVWAPGTVMLTKRAPVGDVVINSVPMATNQGFLNFRCGPRLLPEYLYYWFKANTPYLDAVANGSTYPELYVSDLFEFDIALPGIEEQRQIVSILAALDDKIESNRRIYDTLEALGRSIFKSWFVDFDPVRTKARTDGSSGEQPSLYALFPDRILPTDGELPDGWTRKGIAGWVAVLSGGTPSKSNATFWDGDIPWISPKVMTALHADEADEFVTPSAIGEGTRLAPTGSTLVMVRGMGLHERVRVSQARRDLAFNQDVKVLVPRDIEPSLLLFALLHSQPELLGRVESSGHGTGRLPTDLLLAYQVTMPPSDSQAKLVGIFDAVNDRIACARSESRVLTAIRDTLLPRLLSGDVRASEAEKIVSAPS